MLYPQSRLMVFCKAPEAGKVKTRLSKPFEKRGMDGKQIAAKIHEHLVFHCLQNVTKNAVAPVQLWCSPDKSHPFFQKCKDEFNIELKNQGCGDLGERMSRSFDDVLSENESAIVVGTDCPRLNSSMVERAFTQLHESKCSVIGPAEDGGYFLVGLTRAQPDIFKDISWGSSQVFNETLNKMSGDVHELGELWDVDRPEDLQRLLVEAGALDLSDEFRSFLQSIA